DAETGDQVPEAEIAERYHDEVLTRCGIREFADEGALENGTAPLLTSVFLDKDLSFAVSSEAEARAFVAADPERTVARVGADGEWQVTRKAGTRSGCRGRWSSPAPSAGRSRRASTRRPGASRRT